MFLSGVAGRGKTTIAHQFEPNLFATSEQLNTIAAARHREIVPHHGKVRFVQSRSMELPEHDEPIWVADSVSNFEGGADFYLENMVPWAKGEIGDGDMDRLAIAVAQATKEGTYKGASSLPHMADVCVHLQPEDYFGESVAVVWKNRYDGLAGVPGIGRFYYMLTGSGAVPLVFEGVLGVKPEDTGFSFEPKWADKKRWYPGTRELDGCRAVASVPAGTFVPWARGAGSKAEKFAIVHGVCWEESPNHERVHALDCPNRTP